jgi:hypothetical protein
MGGMQMWKKENPFFGFPLIFEGTNFALEKNAQIRMLSISL